MFPHGANKDRGRTVRRLVALIREAQTSRCVVNMQALARRHGVSTRTIRRDLEAIEMEIPVRWKRADL